MFFHVCFSASSFSRFALASAFIFHLFFISSDFIRFCARLAILSCFKHLNIWASSWLQYPKNFLKGFSSWHLCSICISSLHCSLCKCADKSVCIIVKFGKYELGIMLPYKYYITTQLTTSSQLYYRLINNTKYEKNFDSTLAISVRLLWF